MADSLFNPLFSSANASPGGGALTSIVSTAVGGVTNQIDSAVISAGRGLLAPLTNNRVTGPVVGQLLGQLGITGGANGTFKQARGRLDPIFGWNFDAFLNDIVSTAYIEEVSVPYYHFDRLPHYRGGKNYYFPGDFDLSQFAVQFYEDRMLTTTRAMMGWRSMIRNRNNTVNMPSSYKKKLQVAIKDQHFQVVGTAILYGCWPISWDPIKFSSSSNERVIMTVEMSADDVDFEFSSSGQASGGGLLSALGNAIGSVTSAAEGAIGGVISSAVGSATDAAGSLVQSITGITPDDNQLVAGP